MERYGNSSVQSNISTAQRKAPDIGVKPPNSDSGFKALEFLPERVSLLYKLCGGDTPMILFVGAASAFALWGFVKESLLLSWGIWLCAASLARFVLARVYSRLRPPREEAARWENIFCLVSAMIGAGWGISILLTTSENPTMPELTVTFLLSSISMGLPPSLAASPKAFASFVLPIIAPIVGLLFSTGGNVNTAAGLLLLIFTGVLISIYVSANQALIATLSSGRENARLLERIDLAVQSSALAVWEWEAARGTFFFDAAWASMLRRAPQDMFLSPGDLKEMLHPEDVEAFEKAWAECLNGARPDFAAEIRARTQDGDWIWFLARGRMVERQASGGAQRITGTILDISTRKLAEGEMFAALQREKELNEMKTKFVSIASHELRTPLTTILSSAELLEHYSATLSEQDRGGLLRSIEDAVRRMTSLINDVLIIGKSGSGKLNFNPSALDVKEIVQRIVEGIRIGEGRSRKISLDCRLNREVRRIDEQLVRHILNNLLSNAIKYSADGSAVSVRLADNDKEVVIEVTDQGIGIPEKDQAKLFESFHRASNVGDRPGTGLGLAIVKTAAELHRGWIDVQSRPGVGTRFTVTLLAEAA